MNVRVAPLISETHASGSGSKPSTSRARAAQAAARKICIRNYLARVGWGPRFQFRFKYISC